MIKIEYLDGNLVKHYSTAGVKILQNETSAIEVSFVDTLPCMYTYSETDEVIMFEDELTGDEFMSMIEEVL